MQLVLKERHYNHISTLQKLVKTKLAVATVCPATEVERGLGVFYMTSQSDNGELKEGQRRCLLRERHKTMERKVLHALHARAFYICVHFYAVVALTTTCFDQISGYVENASTLTFRTYFFLFVCLFVCLFFLARSLRFCFSAKTAEKYK